MHRFFCPSLSELSAAALAALQPGGPAPASPATPESAGPIAHLDRDESHHARRVLRLELGEEVALFDGQGRVGRGILTAWGSGGSGGGAASVRLLEATVIPAPRTTINVAVALPKGSHADEMVAALSQLGVHHLTPLMSRRAIVDPRPAKLERFNRAAIESGKQCGRAYLMAVTEQAGLDQVLSLDHDLRLFATQGPPAGPVVAERLGNASRVLILIGPEGGWAPEEVDMAKAAGCLSWSLGPNVLRIETAAAAAAAVAGYMVMAT